MPFNKSLQLQPRFNEIIPGGGHTYAKGDDQFPEFIPPYIKRGEGCRVWDADDNEYIEYGNGLRSVSLGHAFQPVVDAVIDQIKQGTNFGRPALIELECAEEFLSIVDGAEMVKFCKNGSDATDGAVKLARAYTGRDLIGVCVSHPFFSVGDWFIGTTPLAGGIPEGTKKMSLPFYYNDIASAKKIFKDNSGKIACLILEAQKYEEPENNFLNELKELCHQNGALFILDEMITGFRWHLGGAQKKFNIVPDLSCWGKAMGNGFAVAALAGKKEFMKLGGLDHERERVFLLSTTHGAETHGLAAAIATIRFYKKNNVVDRLYQLGEKLSKGINSVALDLNIENQIGLIGPACCSVYTTRDANNELSQSFRTLFLQETMKRGLLMPSAIISYSHNDKDIDETVSKLYEALAIYKKALNEGIEKYLEGRSVKPVWCK